MKYIFSLIAILLSPIYLFSQLLPPNQPEQDVCYALNLCGDVFYSPYSYQGIGRVLELASSPCNGGEGNTMWLKVEVVKSGSIVFVIKPVNPLDDYDFSVVDATHKECQAVNNYLVKLLTSTDVIRCNYNNNQTANPGYIGPEIGLDYNSQLQFVPAGTTGSNFLQKIDADSGDVYLVLINNWGTGGGPSSGFSIDFSGSTAEFLKDPPPLYDSLQIACSESTTIEVYMNTLVDCQSIAADGSDFTIEPAGGASVIGAAGVNCNGADGYTNHITLKLDQPLPGGTYTLKPKTGTDGNTLQNACRVEQPLTDSISFTLNTPSVDLGADLTTCPDNTIQLQAQVSGVTGSYSILWSPSNYLNNVNITDPLCTPPNDIIYTVKVWLTDQPECSVQEDIHISVLKGFELLNRDTAICLGTALTLRVEGDSRYQYNWTPEVDNTDPLNKTVQPDSTTVYTVTASYPGCTDSIQAVTIEVDPSIRSSFLYLESDKRDFCVGETIHLTPGTDSFSLYLSWNFNGEKYESQRGQRDHAFSYAGTIPLAVASHYKACPPVVYMDTFTVSPFPIVVLDNDATLCLNGGPLVLNNLYTAQDDEGYQYLWSTGSTTKELQVTHPGIYSLMLTNAQGCTTTESIQVAKGCYIDIPNAFTPNGDGSNDYFFPRQLLGQGVSSFHFQIINRWGQVLFETSRTTGRGWDGRYKGKEQPMGVYIYSIKAELENGKTEEYKGNVTLVR
jgi:gliding motility-associated-like protein